MIKFNLLDDSIAASVKKEKIFVYAVTLFMGLFGIGCSYSLVAIEDYFALQNTQSQFRYTLRPSTSVVEVKNGAPRVTPERKEVLKSQCKTMGIPECQ